MQRASAGCSISRHSFLRLFVWVWSVKMNNRDLGDTNSSGVISWCRFIKVMNPCFVLYQPSAGIFSLTATCCHHRCPLIGTNPVHVSKLSRHRSLYWLTWWMLAASITPNCWIWMRLIRSPPKMTFVFSVFSVYYHEKAHGNNSCHHKQGQMSSCNLAFEEEDVRKCVVDKKGICLCHSWIKHLFF